MDSKWLDLREYIAVFTEDKPNITSEIQQGFFSQERFLINGSSIKDQIAYRIILTDKTKWDKSKIKTHFSSFVEDSDRREKLKSEIISLCKTIKNMGYDIRITHNANTYTIIVINTKFEMVDEDKNKIILRQKYARLREIVESFTFVSSMYHIQIDSDGLYFFRQDFKQEKENGHIFLNIRHGYKIPDKDKWRFESVISSMNTYNWSPTENDRTMRFTDDQRKILDYQVDPKEYLQKIFENFIKITSGDSWKHFNKKIKKEKINIEIKDSGFLFTIG